MIRSRQLWGLAAGVLCALVGCAPQQTPEPQPTAQPTIAPTLLPDSPLVDDSLDGLSVDANRTYGAISPYVYGTAYGPWVNLAFDLRDEAVDAELTWLRFPGGNWGDLNNITHLQIDQFMEFANLLDAEPTISVRVRGGSPEQSAELVRYVNIEKEYGVRYWMIGNEPNLYEQAEYGTEHYNADWRAHAEAMRAVDPDILLMGPELSQYPGTADGNPTDFAGRDWMREFLTANGDMVDVVSFHRYPYPVSMMAPHATIPELRANTAEWERIIPYVRGEITDLTGREIPVAVTEINSHWRNSNGGEATPDSHYNAIWWSDVLGRMIRQRVHMVSYFLLTSSGSVGTYGMFSNTEARPTYYVYQMYKRFGSELVYAATESNDVTIYAARREDGALTLMVINLSDIDQEKPLAISGFTPSGDAEVWLFDAEHNAEMIESVALVDGTVISLPPQSITLYIIP